MERYPFPLQPNPSRPSSGNTASSSIGTSFGANDPCEWSFSPDDDVDFFIGGNREEGNVHVNRSDISPTLLRDRNDSSRLDTPISFRPIDFPLAPPGKKSELSSMLEASGYSSAEANIIGPSPISVISGPSPIPLRPLQCRETERFFPNCSERSVPILIPWQSTQAQHAEKEKEIRHQSSSF